MSLHRVKTKNNKGCINQESRRTSTHNQSMKQQRKGNNPIRLQPPIDSSPDLNGPNKWICKNSACRATLTLDDTFCKRCSCCICHLFDDNKDPSLWLVCSSESGEVDSCGLSCHLECAMERQKVGVVDLGQVMQLDGSYCCASCGKISGVLGCWKKQLVIAKDARRVDVLCYRISLCFKLLDGTSRFKDLHEILIDAKAKLETEVGPVNGVSAKMARGIVSRLSVAGDVQKLCSLAVEKADSWLSTMSTAANAVDSLPAACRFQFEELTSSSLIIVLKEPYHASADIIKGYKLWYCRSRDESHPKEPICVFPRSQRRILISNLQPCTEYTFRIVSYTESGDSGHSEAKCFTGSKEIIHKHSNSTMLPNHKTRKSSSEAVGSSGFKVRDLGKVLRMAWTHEEGSGLDGFCSADGEEECCGRKTEPEPSYVVPDLNAEAEDMDCMSEQFVDPEEDRVKSNGSVDDSRDWLVRKAREIPAVESQTRLSTKRTLSNNDEAHDSDSVLMNGSTSLCLPSKPPNHLDESYEHCVKIIRWLECGGHIEQEFRLKFLTWFSLRSSEQERKVVNTYIQTLIDDPSSLAGQLVDSFLDIVSGKRLRTGFCSKLWH
ncbi:hypothetical protein ACHQM5_006448 [Ranunculus cassubicifolius]